MVKRDQQDTSTQDVQTDRNPEEPIGFFRDPTPNENYTASGVNQGLPTPETDPEQAELARVALAESGRDPQPE